MPTTTSTSTSQHRSAQPTSSTPVCANFASDKITIGAGVAIFHLLTERVVVCYHSRDKYWFLPKGRRNASEEAGKAAEREGFEESGYRNRLLPLPIPHRQPYPDELTAPENPFDTEPLWTQLVPQSRSAQYILHWYAAETLPEGAETALPPDRLPLTGDGQTAIATATAVARPYVPPPPFPQTLTLRERMAQDERVSASGERTIYAPRKYEGTGVDEEELLYESYLLPIDEARRRLRQSIMGDVVRRGWEAVKLRIKIEDELEQG